MNKQQLIEQLSLVKHIEGGYFRETYRSPETLTTDRDGCDRAVSTSIYYLLTDDRAIDYFHKNRSDIVHYFQYGSALTYFVLYPNGKLEKIKLGSNLAQGEVLQLTVPGGCWKSAILEQGEFGLIAESVAPGFDYRDLEIGTIEKFKALFPDKWQELTPYIKP